MKNIYILILIILIVIICIGALSLFSSIKKEGVEKPETATDETAEWETYQSSRGFSIKCPADFNGYSDLPHDTTAYQDGLKSGCVAIDNGLASVEIVSWTEFTEQIWGKNFTVDDFLKDETEIIEETDPEFKKEEILLDNNPAVKITYTENLGGGETRKRINIYLEKEKVMYHIYAVINPAKEEEYLPTIEKIISKFDFIDETLTDFCGVSTFGECGSDADCVTGGCSGQVCQSKNEEPVITTCEYRDCFNAEKFGLKCKCAAKKCQWSK